MDEEGYPFNFVYEQSIYEFSSVGQNKTIQKFVLLTQTKDETIFNLALVDLTDDGQVSDQVESNNGDLITVLATVSQIVEHFLAENPDCMIMFRGNDERRHRLYRIVLSRELPAISKKFKVYGGAPGDFAPFKANEDYDFYFIKRH